MIFTKRFFAEAAVLAGLSVVLGLALHVPIIKQFLAGDYAHGFLTGKAGPGVILITLAEAEDLFAGGKATFVDARNREDFSAGHIPGAKNVPFEGVMGKMNGEIAFGAPPGKSVVVYCSGQDCSASLDLAARLRDQGFEEVRVFTGGWAEWIAAGLPAEGGNGQE